MDWNRALLIGAAILAALVIPMKSLANLLARQRIRLDGSGDGRFGSTRSGHIHQGIDLLVVPGEVLTSPVDGIIERLALPYANDPDYSGVVLAGDGYRVKVFYCHLIPGLMRGSAVMRGEPFAIAQDIAAKYGPPMLPHIHVEVRTLGGELVNPERVLSMEPVV